MLTTFEEAKHQDREDEAADTYVEQVALAGEPDDAQGDSCDRRCDQQQEAQLDHASGCEVDRALYYPHHRAEPWVPGVKMSVIWHSAEEMALQKDAAQDDNGCGQDDTDPKDDCY